MKNLDYAKLLQQALNIIEEPRKKTFNQTNIIIAETYWEIVQFIVKEKQKGKERARYE